MNKQRSLGSLADLAKILEEASNPTSCVREDRKEKKPKLLSTNRKKKIVQKTPIVDTKRKLWYEKKLKDKSSRKEKTANKITNNSTNKKNKDIKINNTTTNSKINSLQRAAASKIGINLLENLVNIQDIKTNVKKDNKTHKEAWRRKPGDPIF